MRDRRKKLSVLLLFDFDKWFAVRQERALVYVTTDECVIDTPKSGNPDRPSSTLPVLFMILRSEPPPGRS